jgi:hypothetical protein
LQFNVFIYQQKMMQKQALFVSLTYVAQVFAADGKPATCGMIGG